MPEAGQDSQGEKKYDATEHKLREARQQGRTPHAPDVPKLALMGVFFLLALLPGSLLARAAPAWLAGQLGGAAALDLSGALHLAADLLLGLSGLALVLAAVGAIGATVPGGWAPSVTPIIPDVTRLNPAKGIRDLFSAQRFTETFKAVLKFVIIGSVGTVAFLFWRARIAALPQAVSPDWALGLEALLWILGACWLAGAIIAIVDTPLQVWFYRHTLRMSEQELRDERKHTEVRPEVRRRLRQAQSRAARARMMRKVPEASVVTVNPAHYAVALRYHRQQDAAPVVIATGAGALAERICDVARAHAVPIIAAPPLTRALYFHCEPGEPVPAALYRACAEIIAYVWRLNLWAAGQGEEPTVPTASELGIEARLDPQHDWNVADEANTD